MRPGITPGACFAALAFLVAAPSAERAALGDDPYPSRPVRVVVPFLPAGSTDTLGRLAAHALSEHFGQQFVVENVAGAGGTIGATQVGRANPDGYTLLVGTPGSITINPHLQRNLPYDPLHDFRPVAILGDTAGVVIVRKDSPIKTLGQLIALAKARPGALTFGSAGVGSFTHLGGELFEHTYGVVLTHVPYRGSGQSVVDFLAGRLDVIFGSVQGYLGMGDRVKALGLAAAERSRLAPDIPTVDELGLPGYRSSSWTGLFAPAATPRAVVATLNEAIVTALHSDAMVKRYADLGVDPATRSPEEFAGFLTAEFGQMGTVLKAAGLEPQ
jgi:tripartite-type tricarboxylate transporter receptor subunit TctC